KSSDYYLSILYDELHKHLYDSRVIHADETPFQVVRDGRPPGSKSYMCYVTSSCPKVKNTLRQI
ncbi:MAG: IS66 family transposase, partial [Lachnospiraceae bacterium]|nr:IS66 family transposase [Lachnospiraceae bacterium]